MTTIETTVHVKINSYLFPKCAQLRHGNKYKRSKYNITFMKLRGGVISTIMKYRELYNIVLYAQVIERCILILFQLHAKQSIFLTY